MAHPSAYDPLAAEYYSQAHKTSRNFDQTTVVAMAALKHMVSATGLVLEVGAGRGRANEFLGIAPERVVHLDNSEEMLVLQPREKAMLAVLHAADVLPFPQGSFTMVVSFLCDPFLGLDFLGESCRVLSADGLLIATTPSYEWGAPLRQELGLDTATTRFMTKQGVVHAPSALVRRDQLKAMAEVAGFNRLSINVTAHRLPIGAAPVSDDIVAPAAKVGCNVNDLDLIYCLTARKSG
jgi:SAM-dependent methyltransferase